MKAAQTAAAMPVASAYPERLDRRTGVIVFLVFAAA